MPRLTNQRYLTTHRQLRTIWLEDRPHFADLTPREQCALHDYFKPATDLSGQALLEHRQRVTQERPSLPQQAGRALAKLRQGRLQVPVGRQVTAPTTRSKERQISVHSVVRPKPDLHNLALALMSMAQQLAKEDLAAGDSNRRPHRDASSGEDVLDVYSPIVVHGSEVRASSDAPSVGGTYPDLASPRGLGDRYVLRADRPRVEAIQHATLTGPATSRSRSRSVWHRRVVAGRCRRADTEPGGRGRRRPVCCGAAWASGPSGRFTEMTVTTARRQERATTLDTLLGSERESRS